MKDPLLQLHDAILGELEEWTETHEIVERIIDAFRAAHEVVEGEISLHVIDDSGCGSGWRTLPRIAIVPRKQEPTLAEAAEALDAAIGGLANVGLGHNATAAWKKVHDARDVLAAALKREADNG